MNRTIAWTSALLAVALALAAGYYWGSSRPVPPQTPSAGSAAPRRKVLYWYDPMRPEQHFDAPGVSPMGMQLVPRVADGSSTAGIAIDPGVQQNLGIRTVPVRRGHLDAAIRVPGTITWDAREEVVVSLPVEGIVRRLDVRTPFAPVRAGQPLASVLAPAWSTALAEAQALRGGRSEAARGLAAAAQARLRVLGIPARAAGPGGAIVLRAPETGVVSEINAREGQAIAAGAPLFRINGTRSVWLDAALPQAALGDIRAGTPVEARVAAAPDRRFDGSVAALLPELDSASRTQRARIVLRNDEGLLLPGMVADVTLRPRGGREAWLVPTDAVLGNGDAAHVIVQVAPGRFRPVPVVLGRSAGGETEVLDGLQGAERVVADGQFLVDSEASLAGALARLGASPPADRPPSSTTAPDRPAHVHDGRAP